MSLHPVLLLLLSITLLLPPNVCRCALDSVRSETSLTSSQNIPTRAKKCCCCKKDANTVDKASNTSTPPTKENHPPECPVVRKMDRGRLVDADTLVGAAPKLLEHVEPVVFGSASSLHVPPIRPGDPPKQLLYCTFLI